MVGTAALGIAVVAAGGVAGAYELSSASSSAATTHAGAGPAVPSPAAAVPVLDRASAAPTITARAVRHVRVEAFVPQKVAPLTRLRAPDAFVQSQVTLTDAQIAAVRAVPAVTSVTVVDTGRITIDGQARNVLGVDPSTFRAVTPQPSAASDGLWGVVARGDLTAAYGSNAPPRGDLGHDLVVHSLGTRKLRLGALAAFGLDGVDDVVSRSRGSQLGLVPGAGLVVSAPQLDPTALRQRLAAATGGSVELLGQDAASADTVSRSGSYTGRPTTWRQLYIQSATLCPGLSWTVLAAIGQVESGHGRNDGPSSAGAVGPMQFLPATFRQYAVASDGDGKADPWDAFDAVPTAARLLCANGAGQGGAGLVNAVFAYNHADWYVTEVLALAKLYH